MLFNTTRGSFRNLSYLMVHLLTKLISSSIKKSLVPFYTAYCNLFAVNHVRYVHYQLFVSVVNNMCKWNNDNLTFWQSSTQLTQEPNLLCGSSKSFPATYQIWCFLNNKNSTGITKNKTFHTNKETFPEEGKLLPEWPAWNTPCKFYNKTVAKRNQRKLVLQVRRKC